jgi:hypothetical protein
MPEEYVIEGTSTEVEPEHIAYSLDLIGLSAADKEALCMDHSFAPKPTIRRGLASQVKFTIPKTSTLRSVLYNSDVEVFVHFGDWQTYSTVRKWKMFCRCR